MRTIILLFLVSIFSSCSYHRLASDDLVLKEPKQPHFPLKQKSETIVIDAGHGGKDSGSESKKEGYEEKKLTLETALLLRNCLNQLGYRTVLTRGHDTFIPLNTRAEIANDLDADLFISIHYNYSSNREAKGVEVYYYKENTKTPSNRIIQSKNLGAEILKKMIVHTGAESRGLKNENFAVIRNTQMPAILIEGGFLSNTVERKKIHDYHYQRSIAWGIARGVDEYLRKNR